MLYTPERLSKLGEEAARPGSVFSLEDRLGLISDALVLASSGLATTSSALTLINRLRSESECMSWSRVNVYNADLVSWVRSGVVGYLAAPRQVYCGVVGATPCRGGFGRVPPGTYLSFFLEQEPNSDTHIQSLFTPIVLKLGYEYSAQDSADTTQLRTLAVTQAAEGGSKTSVHSHLYLEGFH